jgi:hypothetical protein
MFSQITEKLNCNIGRDGNTDSERIKEIYYKYKSELMQKLDLSEKEIFDRWSDFCSDFWDDPWKTQNKTVGQFLNSFAILCLNFKIDALDEVIDAKLKTFDWSKHDCVSGSEKFVEPETKIQAKLGRQIRLMRVPELEPLDDNGDHMTLNKFISNVKGGGFIDYDGYGKYATKTKKTDMGSDVWNKIK